RDRHTVLAEWQALRDQRACRAGLQILSKLVRFADELHGALNRQAAGVGDSETQLAGVALSELYCDAKQQKDVRHDLVLRTSSLSRSSSPCVSEFCRYRQR